MNQDDNKIIETNSLTEILEEERKQEEERLKKNKKKRGAQRPQALEESISPYKKLDGTLKPTYVLIVSDPDSGRNIALTTLSLHYPRFRKIPLLDKTSSNSNTERRYFETRVDKNDDVESNGTNS